MFFVPLTFELSEGLGSAVDDGLYAMAVRIDYEASIVVGAIVWSWSRASVVFAPMQEC